MPTLSKCDPEVAALIRAEEERLATTIDLIAAENHPQGGILEAQGSVFAVKAAEGYPSARYHAGCRHADRLEALALARCKALFGAAHANVQPHSGVAANWAVYFANRNPIPFERPDPDRSGGLRFGTPAITTRGMREDEVDLIVDWIDGLLRQPHDVARRQSVAAGVAGLCRRFPMPS